MKLLKIITKLFLISLIALFIYWLYLITHFKSKAIYKLIFNKPFIIYQQQLPSSSFPTNQAVYSVTEVNQNPSDFLDQVILVKGTVDFSNRFGGCNLAGYRYVCGNFCHRHYQLIDSNRISHHPLRLNFNDNFQCDGDECALTCTPLKKGQEVIVQGIFQETSDTQQPYYLEPIAYQIVKE